MTVHLVSLDQAEGSSRGVRRVTRYCSHAKAPAFLGSNAELDANLTTKRSLVTCKICRRFFGATRGRKG